MTFVSHVFIFPLLDLIFLYYRLNFDVFYNIFCYFGHKHLQEKFPFLIFHPFYYIISSTEMELKWFCTTNEKKSVRKITDDLIQPIKNFQFINQKTSRNFIAPGCHTVGTSYAKQWTKRSPNDDVMHIT